MNLRSILQTATLIAAAALIGGCGGGGGSPPVANVAPPAPASSSGSGSSGGTTSGGTTTPAIQHPANPGKGVLVTVDAESRRVTASSPAGGSIASARATTGWVAVSNPADDTTLPDDLQSFIAEGRLGTRTVYRRNVRFTLEGGVAAKDQQFVQYALTSCGNPAGAACVNAGNDDELNAAAYTFTADGKKVTDWSAYAGKTAAVTGVGSGLEANGSFCDASGKCGPLVHARYGTYSDASVAARLEGVEPDGDPVLTVTSGHITTGYFYDGKTATSGTAGADMQALKSSNVTATYTGTFDGRLVPDANTLSPAGDVGVDVRGHSSIDADFGKGAVTGQMYGLNGWAEDVTTKQFRPFQTSYGIQIDGTIAGSGYTGTARYTMGPNLGAPVRADGGTGEVSGGFYGPGAAETVGIVRIPGGTPGPVGPPATMTEGVLIGAYGARKN